MPTALLLLTLASPATPLHPELFETHLSAPAGVLLPAVSGSRDVYGGVRMVVSGSILTVLGGAIGAGGLYSLISAANETGSARTVFTVLGWTFFGFGALLAVVGIPLLIVGIVKLSAPRDGLGLTIGQNGSLAVSF